MATFNESVVINGNLEVTGTHTGNIERSSINLVQALFPLEFDRWRVWDAAATLLPGTPASDDLGITTPAFGTVGAPFISTGDVKALGTTTRRARIVFQIPDNFADGQSFSIRFYAGMVTTVAGTSATIDVEVFTMSNPGYSTGTDICQTAAMTINSLTHAARVFTIDSAAIDAGNWLDIRATIVVVDAATGTAVIGAIDEAEVVVQVRG